MTEFGTQKKGDIQCKFQFWHYGQLKQQAEE